MLLSNVNNILFFHDDFSTFHNLTELVHSEGLLNILLLLFSTSLSKNYSWKTSGTAKRPETKKEKYSKEKELKSSAYSVV